MTRINVVKPEILSAKHLGGEWHEIPRLYGYVDAAIERGVRGHLAAFPDTYRLGAGHVLFFYPRMHFILVRHKLLYDEMLRRGSKPSYNPLERHREQCLRYKQLGFWNGYTPTDAAIKINMARLRETNNHAGFYKPGVEWR